MTNIGRGVNLKNEEEVKEYLENLGVEYKFGCYEEKKGEVCHLLGDYFSSIARSASDAYKTYRENCDVRRFAASCHMTGGYIVSGKQCDRNLIEALSYFEKACSLNHYHGCRNAALLKTTVFSADDDDESDPMFVPYDKRVTLDMPGAVLLFDKACSAGNDAPSCLKLSQIFELGAGSDVSSQPEKARRYAERACALGSFKSCLRAKRFCQSGYGGDVDLERAKFYGQLVADYERAMRYGGRTTKSPNEPPWAARE